MAEVDPLIFRILSDSKAARKDVADFQRMTGQGLNRVERDVLRLEAQMKRSTGAIGGHLKGLVASLGALFTGRELVGMVDSFTRLQNSLKVAGLEGQNLERVQSRLLDLSTRYGVGIEGLANLYGKASDAGRSFGASEEQVLQLTEATSQALKITGTSAAQAQGAILGLSQALASGTVRAEEYNQINEGGLRPLLQAAAASQRFGGDINKLRAAMLDGKVTSQEFFNGIIAGAAELDAKASKATLTLAGAFESLSSRLTVYVGQSAEANGVTAALAGAMQLLAENLDIIIPALATIAAVMGGAMLVNAVAGSRAFFALTAAMGGAATAAEAATFAFGGLGAVLTGSAGVAAAVFAVGAGLYYLASESDRTAASVKTLEESNKDAAGELDRMIGKLKAAGVQTDELAAAADNAKNSVDGLADAYRNALIEARNFNKGTAGGKLQEQNDIVRSSQDNQASIRRQLADAYQGRSGSVARFGNLPGQDDRVKGLERQLTAEIRREKLARGQIETISVAAQNGVDLSADSGTKPATATTKPKPTRTPRTRAGNDPLDDAFRNAQELRALQLEEIRAKEQEATAATQKAGFAREALALEGEMRRKDLEEAVRKGQLRQDEADARLKIIDNLYGAADEIRVQGRETAYQAAITREEQERIARQTTDAMRDELDALGAEAGVTDVRKARVAIERRMLELQQQIERKLLDERIARGDVADAAAARAALARKQDADRKGFDKDNLGPLGQYAEDLKKAGLNLDDQFENVAVNGLRSLNDGLADAIANSENLGDVFKNVAKQIIADLIRIAIQQTIVNALMNVASSFLGGGGDGGLSSANAGFSIKSLGKTMGRASGGYVAPGQTVRVNEQRGGAEYLRMGSQGGTVIPLGQVNQRAAPAGAQQQPIVQVHVTLSDDLNARIQEQSGPVAAAVLAHGSGQIIETAISETMRRATRPRMPGAGR